MTDNYPAVKVLIKILTLSPILASPSSRFFLPRVCFCFCFHPLLIPSFTFLTPLCSSVCLLFFSAHLSFLFSFFFLPFFLLPIPFVRPLRSFSASSFLSVLPHLPLFFSYMSLSLCLIQTSRRSSHRCEWSTVREQHHALERCYFWVSHALNSTPPCCLYCATVIVLHGVPPTHPASHPFAVFKYF